MFFPIAQVVREIGYLRIYELRMSEDAAFRRAKAAHLVRQYPELRSGPHRDGRMRKKATVQRGAAAGMTRTREDSW